jgi:predicted transcriptional regulator
MGKPFTVARRAQLQMECWERSITGESQRSIARALGISHTTVASYIRKEEERMRLERRDCRQWALSAHKRLLKASWDLINSSKSDHARSMAIHAANGTLAAVAQITGVRAPVKHKTDVTIGGSLDGVLSIMSPQELAAFQMLISKKDPNEDVLAKVLESYQGGTLALEEDDVGEVEALEEGPEVERTHDDWDFGLPQPKRLG